MDIIDKDLKVELGQLIRVNNLERKLHENEVYVSLQVEDEDGDNERCILFSVLDIHKMETIKSDFLNDNMKYGRFYKFNINGKDTNLIKVKSFDKTEKILRISNSQLKTAELRASKNKEDLTKKGLLTDLLD